MKKYCQIAMLALISFTLLISFNNCSGSQNNEQVQSSGVLVGGCDQVADVLRTPNSIGAIVDLINALPKPTSIDCFLKALKKPLRVMAVNNTFSAQPAVGNESPRIFIVNTKLSISVVPAGVGRYLVELSEPSSATKSFKAELEFPIQQRIEVYDAISRITDKVSGDSQCILCHRNEEKKLYPPDAGYAFNSDIVRPNEYQRVFAYYLRNQAYMCNTATDKYRCDILKAIFMTGEAEDSDFLF